MEFFCDCCKYKFNKELMWYRCEDGVKTYTETCTGVEITTVCISYFNNLYVLCAFVGNMFCANVFVQMEAFIHANIYLFIYSFISFTTHTASVASFRNFLRFSHDSSNPYSQRPCTLSTSPRHLSLTPSGCIHVSLLDTQSSSILAKWPAQYSLAVLITTESLDSLKNRTFRCLTYASAGLCP